MSTEWLQKWDGETVHWHNLDGYFKPIVTRFFITWFATAPMISSLSKNYPIFFELPFNWWVLWLASLTYAIAFALHAWRCPRFIKRYPTFLAYKARGHSPRWLVWEFFECLKSISDEEKLKLANRLVEKGYAKETAESSELRAEPKVRREGTIYQFPHDGNTYELSIKEDAKEDTEKDVFWEIFGRWTSSRLKIRMSIWALLAVAASFVLWTVLENIWFVISLLGAAV